LDSLRELLIEELRDLYSAETQLVDALPKMAEAASSRELKSLLKITWRKQKDMLSAWKMFLGC
jgi:ferritin-like metal-binding protein YciE